jgi:hypothetical protein
MKSRNYWLRGMGMSDLVTAIMEYESDTFTASGFGLKRSEARKIAAKLSDIMMDEWVDGVLLDRLLYELRENENA